MVFRVTLVLMFPFRIIEMCVFDKIQTLGLTVVRVDLKITHP